MGNKKFYLFYDGYSGKTALFETKDEARVFQQKCDEEYFSQNGFWMSDDDWSIVPVELNPEFYAWWKSVTL